MSSFILAGSKQPIKWSRINNVIDVFNSKINNTRNLDQKEFSFKATDNDFNLYPLNAYEINEIKKKALSKGWKFHVDEYLTDMNYAYKITKL